MTRLRLKYQQATTATKLALWAAVLVLVPLCGYAIAQTAIIDLDPITSLADGDHLVVTDASDGDASVRILLSNFDKYHAIQQTITAFAGGGQGSATQITGTIAHVSTVATDGDSVKLPDADATSVGRIVYVLNTDATESVDVFPFSGADLGQGADTATAIAAGSQSIFFCSATDTWVEFTGGGSDFPVSGEFSFTTDGVIGPRITSGRMFSDNDNRTGGERFGDSATLLGDFSCAFGFQSLAGTSSISIGRQASSLSNTACIMIGQNAQPGHASTASNCISIGITTSASGDNAPMPPTTLAVGLGVSRSASNKYTDYYFGTGFKSTAPNSITFHGPGGGGTDVDAGDITLGGGMGTGTGAGGNISLATAFASTTGSTQNALVTRFIPIAKANTVTDAATSLFEIALPTLTTAGGTIEATIRASDGTDVQSLSQTVNFATVNKGGVYTHDVNVVDSATAVSAGTLTATWAFMDGTDKVTMQVTPTGSLTETTYDITYTITNNSRQAITPL